MKQNRLIRYTIWGILIICPWILTSCDMFEPFPCNWFFVRDLVQYLRRRFAGMPFVCQIQIRL